MTRQEAHEKVFRVARSMQVSSDHVPGSAVWDNQQADLLVRAVEALGLIKFDEPVLNDGAAVIDDGLIELLRACLESPKPRRALLDELRAIGLALVKVRP